MKVEVQTQILSTETLSKVNILSVLELIQKQQQQRQPNRFCLQDLFLGSFPAFLYICCWKTDHKRFYRQIPFRKIIYWFETYRIINLKLLLSWFLFLETSSWASLNQFQEDLNFIWNRDMVTFWCNKWIYTNRTRSSSSSGIDSFPVIMYFALEHCQHVSKN